MSWTVLLSTLDSGPSTTYTHFNKELEVLTENFNGLNLLGYLMGKKLIILMKGTQSCC